MCRRRCETLDFRFSEAADEAVPDCSCEYSARVGQGLRHVDESIQIIAVFSVAVVALEEIRCRPHLGRVDELVGIGIAEHNMMPACVFRFVGSQLLDDAPLVDDDVMRGDLIRFTRIAAGERAPCSSPRRDARQRSEMLK